jgi:hypothetical protein
MYLSSYTIRVPIRTYAHTRSGHTHCSTLSKPAGTERLYWTGSKQTPLATSRGHGTQRVWKEHDIITRVIFLPRFTMDIGIPHVIHVYTLVFIYTRAHTRARAAHNNGTPSPINTHGFEIAVVKYFGQKNKRALKNKFMFTRVCTDVIVCNNNNGDYFFSKQIFYLKWKERLHIGVRVHTSVYYYYFFSSKCNLSQNVIRLI